MRASEQVAEGRIRGIKESDERIKGGLRTAGKLALTAAGTTALSGGAALSAKIAPFLSEYITPELALKGISKVSPKFGDALKRGMEGGLSLESGLDFIKQSMEKPKDKEEQEENPQQNGNVIEQYSPELNQFIMSEIEKGRQPLEAGALASLNPKFKKIIDKLTQDHKSPFSSLLQTVYGGGQQTEQQPQNQQQMQQGQPQQGGQGQQALMAILQKIQQSRGG